MKRFRVLPNNSMQRTALRAAADAERWAAYICYDDESLKQRKQKIFFSRSE
jgi:hypothetical protein